MACNCRATAAVSVDADEIVTPCGECRVCRKIESGTHPDVIHIKPTGSLIRIAQIRELCHTLAMRPYEAHIRVVVISDAQTMNPEASNALLKDFRLSKQLITNGTVVIIETAVARFAADGIAHKDVGKTGVFDTLFNMCLVELRHVAGIWGGTYIDHHLDIIFLQAGYEIRQALIGMADCIKCSLFFSTHYFLSKCKAAANQRQQIGRLPLFNIFFT